MWQVVLPRVRKGKAVIAVKTAEIFPRLREGALKVHFRGDRDAMFRAAAECEASGIMQSLDDVRPSAVAAAASASLRIKAEDQLGWLVTQRGADPFAPGSGWLATACEAGDLSFLLRLIARYELTGGNLVGETRGAFFGACIAGHADLARWLLGVDPLLAQVGLDAPVPRSSCGAPGWGSRFARSASKKGERLLGERLLGELALRGRTEILDMFPAKPGDSSMKYLALNALSGACRQGHLSTVKWLVARFALEARDLRPNGELLILKTASPPVRDWLLEALAFSEEELAVWHPALRR